MKTLLILLPLLIATCCSAAGCFRSLFSKSLIEKAKSSKHPFQDINKHLCRNVESEDVQANIEELMEVHRQLQSMRGLRILRSRRKSRS